MVLVFIVGMGLLGLWPATGDAGPHAAVRYARVRAVGDLYVLDARVNIALTQAARDALLSGVPLIFELGMDIERPRAWWPNEEVADMDQKLKLSYHALSQQFLVKNLNTGIQQSFSQLEPALEEIGELRGFPLIDATLLEPGEQHVLEIRARLDIEQLPFPLMVQAYTTKNWKIDSGWYRVRIP